MSRLYLTEVRKMNGHKRGGKNKPRKPLSARKVREQSQIAPFVNKRWHVRILNSRLSPGLE